MRYFGISALGLLVLAVLLWLPVEIPYTIQAPAKILPQREWTLVRGREGGLVSTLRDHRHGAVEHYAVMGFVRGDQASFRQHPRVVRGAAIGLGDTVGLCRSEQLQSKWTSLKGELSNELAKIAVYESGKKEPILRAAQLNWEYRRTQRAWQEREVDRLSALWRKEVITDVEIEAAKNLLALQKIEESRARAEVQAMESGSKTQELEWRRGRVETMQEELKALEERLEKSVIRSPINGRIATLVSGDTIAVVYDTTAYIALVPTRWKERGHIALEQRVEVPLAGGSRVVSGRVVHLGKTVQTLMNQQFFNTMAVFEGGSDLLAPGLVVRCEIIGPPVSLWQLARRLLLA